MTIEELEQQDTLTITDEFGEHIVEEVAQSANVLALQDLKHLIKMRLAELKADGVK